jgi:signal peptidase II
VSERGLRVLALWLTALVVALDQATKVAVDRILQLHESRSVLAGVVQLTYVRNRGAAFGVFSDSQLPYQSWLFAAVSVLALVAIAVYGWKLPASSQLPRLALALIIGGALGNLCDRVRLGYVIDFLDVYWGRYHWPAFNVADSAITAGVALLVIDMLRQPNAAPNGAGGERPDPPGSATPNVAAGSAGD